LALPSPGRFERPDGSQYDRPHHRVLRHGRIFEAKTEVNATLSLTTEEPPPAGSEAFDLRIILTHEAGHFLGLAHATETTSIMYAYYQAGATVLTPDDVSGICTIYPPSGPSSGACSVTRLHLQKGSSQALAAWIALCICGAARRRARRSSRLPVFL
jgi:hypothetical protein